MTLNAVQEAALTLLEKLTETNQRFAVINRDLKALCGDFYPHINPVADCLEPAMTALLNAALGDGDETATYFLYENPMSGRAIHDADGTTWPLQTAADLRTYLEHLSERATGKTSAT